MNFLNITIPFLIVIPCYLVGYFWAKCRDLEEKILTLRLDYWRDIKRDSEIEVPLVGGMADGGKMKVSPLTRELVIPIFLTPSINVKWTDEPEPRPMSGSWGSNPEFAQATYVRHIEYRHLDSPKGDPVGD